MDDLGFYQGSRFADPAHDRLREEATRRQERALYPSDRWMTTLRVALARQFTFVTPESQKLTAWQKAFAEAGRRDAALVLAWTHYQYGFFVSSWDPYESLQRRLAAIWSALKGDGEPSPPNTDFWHAAATALGFGRFERRLGIRSFLQLFIALYARAARAARCESASDDLGHALLQLGGSFTTNAPLH